MGRGTGFTVATAACVSVSAATAAFLWYSKKKSTAEDGSNPKQSEDTDDRMSQQLRRKLDRAAPPVGEIQTNPGGTDDDTVSPPRILTRGSVTIVHGSMTGTCRIFAERLHSSVAGSHLGCVEDWDWWDELLNDEEIGDGTIAKSAAAAALLIVLLPTYTDGTWPPCATHLQDALRELETDWRIAKNPLKNKLRVAVFGMGSSEYYDESTGVHNMGQPAKECIKSFQSMGAKVVTRLAVGDDAVSDHAEVTFEAWRKGLERHVGDSVSKVGNESCGCGASKENSSGGCCQSNEMKADDFDGFDEADEDDYPSDSEDEDDGQEPEVMDLEDMGDAVMVSGEEKKSAEPREMVTASQAKALKKEGYKLIGTHSAVKLCRWTKHQLRGRGGCYKHTFYGITSYQCMEATPSLACANKCVFCWRHHKNPVGKEWRWKTDDPNFIVEQAVNTHVHMIKETRGIPGVQLDRWKEAHTVKHCALSLVGEPIMYPRIDELLADLHRRSISTFLVTNGQHPGAIGSLRPITQLYVSVDAPTQESLIAIDRPLFQDAWDRLKQSLSSLKDKGQRTVARLTVVKGWNSDEVAGYAKLIALGKVSLVEVKGVTFCGKSDASNLNMSNSPWHHEVVELTKTLRDELSKMRLIDNAIPEYDLACEHKHSCSVLLARVDQFAVNVGDKRTWRTWIDYEKFQMLAAKFAADPTFRFTVEDYTAETPTWALFGSNEEGFDPTDKRHRKKAKHPMYTKFDDKGVPTHDDNHEELSMQERERLMAEMTAKKKQIGEGSTVTELRGGEKEITDASLMFRGLVVVK